MNVYLGIDWSQMKHDLCWMNEAGAVVAQQTILHSADGFAKLDDSRQRLGIAPEACLVGIETAHSLLIDFLWARGYTKLYVLAPGMINSTRGRFRQSGAKNDASDARIIADVLRTDRARLTAWHPDGPLVQQMRAKVGLILYLKRNIVRWTNRLRAVLLRYYPAATEVFGELTAQIALHFVQGFPTPQAAAALSWDDFVAFAHRHHYTNMQRLPDRFARMQRTGLRLIRLRARPTRERWLTWRACRWSWFELSTASKLRSQHCSSRIQMRLCSAPCLDWVPSWRPRC
jgi:hypothetical protein